MKRTGHNFQRWQKKAPNATPRSTRYCPTCLCNLTHKTTCTHCPKPKAEAQPILRISSCTWCDMTYAAHHRQSYCSDQCRKEAILHTRRSNRDDRHCECGALIGPGRYKCDNCNAEARRVRKRSAKRRARAHKYGIKPGRYTLRSIAQRDELVCGLCHKPVDMSLSVPEHGAPTVDHIVPLARGGSDLDTNVQLAHFICNVRARTKDRIKGGGWVCPTGDAT